MKENGFTGAKVLGLSAQVPGMGPQKNDFLSRASLPSCLSPRPPAGMLGHALCPPQALKVNLIQCL